MQNYRPLRHCDTKDNEAHPTALRTAVHIPTAELTVKSTGSESQADALNRRATCWYLLSPVHTPNLSREKPFQFITRIAEHFAIGSNVEQTNISFRQTCFERHARAAG